MNIDPTRSSPINAHTLGSVDLGEPLTPSRTARDDVDLHLLDHLKARLMHLMGAAFIDDSLTGHNLRSKMSREAGAVLAGRRRYDHWVALDRVTPASHVARRAAQLGRVNGADAAAHYGQGFARDQRGEPFYPRLNLEKDDRLDYHREVPSPDIEQALATVYRQRFGEPPRGCQLAFVNSEYACEHVVAATAHPDPQLEAYRPPVKALGAGVLAVPCMSSINPQTIADVVTWTGGRPSAYRVSNAGLPPKVKPAPQAQIDNAALLKALAPNASSALTQRLRLADLKRGTGGLAHAAAALVDNLYIQLSRPAIIERDRHNPLLAKGLIGIKEQLEALNALHYDTPRFGNAYRGLMEEIHVVLTATKPYTEADFKQVAQAMLEQRISPGTQRCLAPTKVHLATSGMNAIVQGLDLAAQLTGSRQVTPLASVHTGTTPLYYEVDKYLDASGFEKLPSGRLLLGTLGNSYPAASGMLPWNVDSVATATKQHLRGASPEKPIILVLDTTVEGKRDLRELTDKLRTPLAKGELLIVLCKSYQKFANQCSAKIMAGSIAVLAGNALGSQAVREQAESVLSANEKRIGWIDNDESQLMTHLIGAGQQEFTLLKRALNNAAFVKQTCFKGVDGHAGFDGFEAQLPFAMLNVHEGVHGPQQCHVSVRGGDGQEALATFYRTDSIDPDLIRHRDSFGFSDTVQSSLAGIDGYGRNATRLSFGQESRQELIEMFYMPSRLMGSDNAFSPQKAQTMVHQLIREAMPTDQYQAMRHMPLARQLAWLGRNETVGLSDQTRDQGSLTQMRTELEQPEEPKGYTLNRIASIVGHLGNLLINNALIDDLASGPDRGIAEDLLEGMMGCDLLGVSNKGRETLARFQVVLCQTDMRSPHQAVREQGVQQLVDSLKRMNVSASRGAYWNCVPDKVFKEQTPAMRTQLLERVFLPLSMATKFSLIQTRLNKGEAEIAKACLDAMQRQIEAPGATSMARDVYAKAREALSLMAQRTASREGS